MYDPWFKATFPYKALGSNLEVDVPHDVFSTQRIDEGTLLLLDHLPDSHPEHVLDMGCGYGALGLPIAAKFSESQIEMVDRDLLAARASARNAAKNKLTNVDAYGSLGFLNVKRSDYDWILCNVPARIGRPFIENLVSEGNSRLKETGQIRIVVITDLGPLIREIATDKNWPMVEVAAGPRHLIFAMKAIPKNTTLETALDSRTLYLRDEVKVADLVLARPFDIGGDDQKRLHVGLPVLIDMLPRGAYSKDQRILCFRSGYGQLPLLARKRWPEATVVAIDRDLLGTQFTKINAKTLQVESEKLEVREHAHFPEALLEGEKFDLILGELSPSAGEAVAFDELRAIEKTLRPGGEALILCLEKIEKDFVRKYAEKYKRQISRALTRDGYTVIRIS